MSVAELGKFTTEAVGKVVEGGNECLVMREKKGVDLELGDLLAIDSGQKRFITMVSALEYGSNIDEERIYRSAGADLERQHHEVAFLDPDINLFRRVMARILLEVKAEEGGRLRARSPRSIPDFMSKARMVDEGDFGFLETPDDKITLGKVRSGSKRLKCDYCMDGSKMLSHHVLISAQTGRGKSNLVKVMLWEAMKRERFGVLVMDVHNEYYGRGSQAGLKDHPDARERLVYYSKDPPPGQKALKINLRSIDPQDLVGVLKLTDAQSDAVYMYRHKYGRDWIRSLMSVDEEKASEYTLKVLRRKFEILFMLTEQADGSYRCGGDIFNMETAGEATVREMADALEGGKVVLVDGSSISDDTGLVIASACLREAFRKYEGYKMTGELDSMPQLGVVLEEAPRVLAEGTSGSIFSRIAREGRKFKIGLIAITQLVSVIPPDILANIGTKIIMGNEMAFERKRLMESAAQDLSAYDQIIASLEKGESIVSSIFSQFPVPIYTPLFEDVVREERGASTPAGRAPERRALKFY
ncbi:MAG TPA: DUF87 domain-containing protein [Candidatus Methanomethylicus sp.]|nr:DUF87 domain-containing protein [Candidatus Methanomethylicus sp.]